MNPKDIIKQNRLAYNLIAEEFLLKRQYRLDELRFLEQYLDDGDKILDLGCGWGRLYQVFVGRSINYVGADQSIEPLKIARKKFPKIKFVRAEMTNLPFENEEFNKIFCINTFHHLLSKDLMLETLQEMKRVLKPGGQLIMTNWNLRGGWREKKIESKEYKDIGNNNYEIPWKNDLGIVLAKRYYHAFSPLELKKLLNQAGFEVEKQYYEKWGNRKKWGKRSNKKDGANIVSVCQPLTS
ncbi:MAG: class I SAM-dependent methyltransferase [Candidatus Magasanikbacteria bacterium]|nr:class I SAM-dependent methyltransferase [Candidatus Magasanikbacteria bacterium]